MGLWSILGLRFDGSMKASDSGPECLGPEISSVQRFPNKTLNPKP